MKYYKNLALQVFAMKVLGIVCLGAGILLLPLFPVALFLFLKWTDPVFLVVMGWPIGLISFGIIFPNLEPNLAIDDKGLYVEFYFTWLFVPWENVMAIHENHLSGLVNFFYPMQKNYFVLVKDKLTLAHYLVSLNQLEGWREGFIISSKIENYEELIAIIKSHVH